jgi:hypothetical protein
LATRAESPATQYIFLVGTGRCGSSVVHEVLARHPEVGFLSNVDDRVGPIFARCNSGIYRHVRPGLTRKGRLRFAPSEGYRILERKVSPAISTPVRDLLARDATPWLGERFRDFFEEQARRQRAPVFLHKFTGWPRARFIDAALAQPRFVHIVRDGRAVANSLLQMPWWRGYEGPDSWGWGPLPPAYAQAWEESGRSFPVLAALEWRLLMDAFEEAEAAVPTDRWLEIRYEDLVGDPRGQTQRILDFAGLRWTQTFGRSFGQHRFDASRVTSYARDLSPQDLAAIQASIGEALARWGYVPPGSLSPPGQETPANRPVGPAEMS